MWGWCFEHSLILGKLDIKEVRPNCMEIPVLGIFLHIMGYNSHKPVRKIFLFIFLTCEAKKMKYNPTEAWDQKKPRKFWIYAELSLSLNSATYQLYSILNVTLPSQSHKIFICKLVVILLVLRSFVMIQDVFLESWMFFHVIWS